MASMNRNPMYSPRFTWRGDFIFRGLENIDPKHMSFLKRLVEVVWEYRGRCNYNQMLEKVDYVFHQYTHGERIILKLRIFICREEKQKFIRTYRDIFSCSSSSPERL